MRTLAAILFGFTLVLLTSFAHAADNTPPEGFTALFNGKDLTGWKGLVGDPKSRAAMKPAELAAAQKEADAKAFEHWKAADGVIVFDGKGDSLCTNKDYADFEMYVDWKIEEAGDSGIYLRGSPQVQIWDYKLRNIGSGGLFNNEKGPANPLVLADKPVGEWNTFYIKMVGDKVTVKLNDQLVVDNVVLENYWERDKPIYPSGQIELQNHGNSLYFKNIYLREIKQDEANAGFGEIRRFDPRLDVIVPPDAKMEKLAEGFEWSEGPVWVKDGGYLLFSDIPRNSVMKWKDGEGISVFLKPAGYTGPADAASGEPGSNGLLIDQEGRLVLCEHGDRRIARLEKDGKKTTLADKYDGKRFNSPNDAVFKANGDLYITDPPYGLPKQADDPSRELNFCGVYRVATDGKVTLLTDRHTRPNGIAFSPDQKILYVAQSDSEAPTITAYDVKADGAIDASKGRVIFDASKAGKEPGGMDGMKVDARGNIFATGPGGVWIIAPDGTPLGLLATGQATANCNFGDDGSTLYITADMYLLRVKLTTKGQGF